MKLTVNVKSEQLGSNQFTYQISVEEKLDKLMQLIILDQEFLTHEAGKLNYGEYPFQEFQSLTIGNLFHGTDRIVVDGSSVQIEILNNKQEKRDTDLLLFDYTQFIKACDIYNDLLKEIEVENGTVFYIQQNREQYLVRKEEHHLEFYHFKRQFDNAFDEEGRTPFFIVEFKSRKELTVSESHFIKKYRYPKSDHLNPVIHLELARISQSVIQEMTLLIHRLFTILGRFVNANVEIDDVEKVPSYIQVDEKETIGFVKYADLASLIQKDN